MYLKEYDIERSPRLRIDSIKEEDAVYEGDRIFNLFFDGSRFRKYPGYRGPDDFEGLTPKNFGHWHYIFEKALSDLTSKGGEEGQKGGERSHLEKWWDALKKVMRLYK